MWRIVLLASLGGTLEFYDFVIFGIFAKDIADAIFPNPTPLISLMVSFAAFAAGYLARPIGGIVLSHFGDRYGRRRVFLISIFVMSGATLGMGLVPSFATWGASGQRADGGAAAGSGILSRRRAAGRADLRGRNRAAAGAVRLRRRVLVRHAGRGGGHRRQPRRSHVAAGGAGGRRRVAHGVHPRRARRPAELRPAALARGIAGVRADEAAGVATAVSRGAADASAAGGAGRLGARRDRRIQRPVLRAHGRVHVGRAGLRPAPGGRLADDSASSCTRSGFWRSDASPTRAPAVAAARRLARARGAGVSVLLRARRDGA